MKCEWLTDTIIEAYFLTFVERYKLFVMNPNQAKSVYETGNTTSQIKKDLFQFDFVAGAVNVKEGCFHHWTLFFISIKTFEIFYLNPLGTSSFELKKALDQWKIFVTNRKSLKGSTWIAKSVEHTTQDDDSSCGAYVCFFLKCLLEKNYASLNSNLDTKDFRKNIEDQIMSHSSKL